MRKNFPLILSSNYRRKEHGAKQRKPGDTLAELHKIMEEEVEDGDKLKEEFSAPQKLSLDTEMERRVSDFLNVQVRF